MKYLSVNNHSKYTQVMWSPGKQNFCGLKEYKKKTFSNRQFNINNRSNYVQVL